MPALLLLGLVGLGAQLINSALGMGYGVTATSFLLALGTVPAVASATVNLSQVGSQFVSGVAHWRFGNVDWRLVLTTGLPGAVGAFIGAVFLSRLSLEFAGPVMSGILLVLGTSILTRFTFRGSPQRRGSHPLPIQLLIPLGLVGGFLNSSGGGGWGPIGTSSLLATGRVEPRKVIGSVSAAEFLVVSAGTIGFAVGLGFGGINVTWVVAMLIGGVIAAPPAAWLARHIPARMLGALVGGLIIVTNVRSMLHTSSWEPGDGMRMAIYLALLTIWGAAIAWSARAHLAERAAGRATVAEDAEDAESAKGTEVAVDTGEAAADAGEVERGASYADVEDSQAFATSLSSASAGQTSDALDPADRADQSVTDSEDTGAAAETISGSTGEKSVPPIDVAAPR